MSTGWDAIVIGAGHQGLVAAATLGRAGRRVLVLEAQEGVGGSVATDDLGHGCRGPAAFAGVELLHPAIPRELDLQRHGYDPLPPRGGTSIALGDGEVLELDPSCEGLERFAGRGEVEALGELERFRQRVTRALEPVQAQRLPPLVPGGVRDAMQLLGLGRRLRSLGPKEMPEALRFLPMSVRDVLDERLTCEPLKAALAGIALTGAWLGPRSPGSAWGLVHHRPAWVEHLLSPPRFARGGPGGLTAALAAAAQAAGAEIRTETSVSQLVVRDGAVRGVVAGQREEEAGAVVSSLDPRRTLLDLLGRQWLDPETALAAENLRGRGSVAIVRLVVDRLPEIPGASRDVLRGRLQIGATLDHLERAFDRAKYGEAPERPYLEVTVPSIGDPSLTAEGRHVVCVWLQFAAPGHRCGLGESVVASLGEAMPGFAETVLALDIQTPADLEARFGASDGCLYHAELALDQLLYMRPLPGWFDYDTPIEGLFLCGSGCHGGGGVTGLAGRNAARRVLGVSGR